MARDGSSGYALQETASSSKPWRHENGIAFALAGGAFPRIRRTGQATTMALIEALFFVFCGMVLMSVLRQASTAAVGDVDGFCGTDVPEQSIAICVEALLYAGLLFAGVARFLRVPLRDLASSVLRPRLPSLPSLFLMLGQVGSLFAVRAIPTGSPLLAGCGAESGVELASLAHASVPGTLVLSPCRVSFLAVAAPLMEEALFRMAVLLVLRNRCSALATSTGSAFLFAFLHMANLARSAFDPTYVAVQVLVALLAGVYYATAALRSGGLWEPLLLHSVNNAVAGLLPTDADPTTCNVLRASIALSLAVLLAMSVRNLVALMMEDARVAAAEEAEEKEEGGDTASRAVTKKTQ